MNEKLVYEETRSTLGEQERRKKEEQKKEEQKKEEQKKEEYEGKPGRLGGIHSRSREREGWKNEEYKGNGPW
jgi:hypothetical protein